MAQDKKSFVLYSDLIHVVKKLVIKDRENKTNYAGELFLHILEYVNDLDPIPIDFIVEMAFEPIKQQLKRDLQKYEVRKQRSVENGKKGGRPKKESLVDCEGNVIPSKSDGNHFIYLIHDHQRDLYKIGETSDLIQRRYDIKQPTSNLDVFCFYICTYHQARDLERFILDTFKAYSTGGDWFDFGKDEAFNIKDILFEKTKGFNQLNKKPDSVNDNVSVNVNDSVNDNEINKEKKKPIFPFRKSLIDIGVDEKVAEDFMKVRKTKNATNTETAFKQLVTQIEKSGKSANECITISVANSWKGFKAEWIHNATNNSTSKPTSAEHVHVQKKKTAKDWITETK